MGWLADEADVINERANHRIATEAHLTQLAVSSVLSKEAGEQFSEELRTLFGASS